MNTYSFNIEWFGHCCYKLEYKGIVFLIDPYDTFMNIDLGVIDADYLLSSSSWHDHGHIGASPKSHILTYPGVYDFGKDFIVYGLKTFESRGSENTIFTVEFEDGFCFTNFADWGDEDGVKKLTKEERNILEKTVVCFTRINDINTEKDIYCFDLPLHVCKPSLIFPEHYYPESFVTEHLPEDRVQGYLNKLNLLKTMQHKIGYNVEKVNDFRANIEFRLDEKRFIEFLKISPQVNFKIG